MGYAAAERDDPVEHDQCADDACGETDPKAGNQSVAHEFVGENGAELLNHDDPRVDGWEVRDGAYHEPPAQPGIRSRPQASRW